MTKKLCLICQAITPKKTSKYCSWKCFTISQKGKKVSLKTRALIKKVRAKQIMRPVTEETRKKISLAHSGSKNYGWKGGKYKTKSGYIHILRPTGYVPEHRFIFEQHTRRLLQPKEVVHHINGKKDDNRIENLRLFKNNSDHIAYHKALKKLLSFLRNQIL